jgi:hypothetical protein
MVAVEQFVMALMKIKCNVCRLLVCWVCYQSVSMWNEMLREREQDDVPSAWAVEQFLGCSLTVTLYYYILGPVEEYLTRTWCHRLLDEYVDLCLTTITMHSSYFRLKLVCSYFLSTLYCHQTEKVYSKVLFSASQCPCSPVPSITLNSISAR